MPFGFFSATGEDEDEAGWELPDHVDGTDKFGDRYTGNISKTTAFMEKPPDNVDGSGRSLLAGGWRIRSRRTNAQ